MFDHRPMKILYVYKGPRIQKVFHNVKAIIEVVGEIYYHFEVPQSVLWFSTVIWFSITKNGQKVNRRKV